jgi:hypothetical protein
MKVLNSQKKNFEVANKRQENPNGESIKQCVAHLRLLHNLVGVTDCYPTKAPSRYYPSLGQRPDREHGGNAPEDTHWDKRGVPKDQVAIHLIGNDQYSELPCYFRNLIKGRTYTITSSLAHKLNRALYMKSTLKGRFTVKKQINQSV